MQFLKVYFIIAGIFALIFMAYGIWVRWQGADFLFSWINRLVVCITAAVIWPITIYIIVGEYKEYKQQIKNLYKHSK